MFGGLGAEHRRGVRDEVGLVLDLEHGVEAALEADRRGTLRAHRLAAEGAGDVPGKDLDAVRQLEQPPQREEEVLGSLLRADREIGARRIADEERVARQDEPRLVGARAVDHGDACVLRTVSGCVDRTQHDGSEDDLGAVDQRIVLVRGVGCGVDRDRQAVLQREPSMSGEVVGVRVRLDRPDDPNLAPRGLCQDALDRVRRIDDRCDARVLVADQVRRTTEVVVNELLEQHET